MVSSTHDTLNACCIEGVGQHGYVACEVHLQISSVGLLLQSDEGTSACSHDAVAPVPPATAPPPFILCEYIVLSALAPLKLCSLAENIVAVACICQK
jgi:hypothetical protein